MRVRQCAEYRRVDVYRIAEKPNAPAAMTEEEFGSLATLIGFGYLRRD